MSDTEKSMSSRISRLESDMDNVVRSVDGLTGSIKALSADLQHSSKTSWSTLASWAGVIITFMGALGYLFNRPVEQQVARNRHTNIRQYDYMNKFREDIRNLYVQDAVKKARIKAVETKVLEIKEEQRRRTSRVYKQDAKF